MKDLTPSFSRLSRNRHATRLARVLELAMTSPCSDQVPTFTVEQAEDFSDLHFRKDSRYA